MPESETSQQEVADRLLTLRSCDLDCPDVLARESQLQRGFLVALGTVVRWRRFSGLWCAHRVGIVKRIHIACKHADIQAASNGHRAADKSIGAKPGHLGNVPVKQSPWASVERRLRRPSHLATHRGSANVTRPDFCASQQRQQSAGIRLLVGSFDAAEETHDGDVSAVCVDRTLTVSQICPAATPASEVRGPQQPVKKCKTPAPSAGEAGTDDARGTGA